MSRIRVTEHPEFTRRFPQALASEVEVRTRAGARVVARAEYPKGHARNPMTDADVVTKFRGLSVDVLGAARVDAALDALWRVDAHDRVGRVLDLFAA